MPTAAARSLPRHVGTITDTLRGLGLRTFEGDPRGMRTARWASRFRCLRKWHCGWEIGKDGGDWGGKGENIWECGGGVGS